MKKAKHSERYIEQEAMKQQKAKLNNHNHESEYSIAYDESEFNEFIQRCIQHKETAESYIAAAIRNGKTRKQAIAELHSMGVFLGKMENGE